MRVGSLFCSLIHSQCLIQVPRFSSPFAVEKVLEERERPKVMQKVNSLFYWSRRGRQGGIMVKNE